MKDIVILQERLALLEKGIRTLTDKIDNVCKAASEISDLRKELKALKVFLSRVYPDFKTEIPEIMKKI